MVTYAITGVTGLIGSNLLWEIIKNNIHDIENIKILCIGRKSKSKSLKKRLNDIIQTDGVKYLPSTDITEAFLQKIMASMIVLETDFNHETFGVRYDNFKNMSRIKIDYFFHSAAITDLSHKESTHIMLKRVIYDGTRRLLDFIKSFSIRIGVFNYVSTAYACGRAAGEILPDFVNPKQDFRNPYERIKVLTEIECCNFCAKENIPIKTFRPSIVVGRVIEPPKGHVIKYNGIYSWIIFFLYLKKKVLGINDWDEILRRPLELPIRIYFNPEGNINMIGVDFCAKVMYKAAVNDIKNLSYHIASANALGNTEFFSYFTRYLNITGMCNVKKMPSRLNQYEKLYYQTVGSIFTPYVVGEPMKFNVDSLMDLCNIKEIPIVDVDERALDVIMGYAKENNFGMNQGV